MLFADAEKIFQIQTQMPGAVFRQIFHTQRKKTHGGIQAPAVRGMIGATVLLLQMHERAGDLDQSFEKTVMLIPTLQPEMLKDIVRFVIIATIEAGKIAQIASVEFRFGPWR